MRPRSRDGQVSSKRNPDQILGVGIAIGVLDYGMRDIDVGGSIVGDAKNIDSTGKAGSLVIKARGCAGQETAKIQLWGTLDAERHVIT